MLLSVQLELHLITHLVIEQGLSDGAEVGDDAVVGIRVPRSQNRKLGGLLVDDVMHGGAGANGDGVGAGVGEVGTASLGQLRFQLCLPAHEHLLHFLGGLVFVVLAKVAVTAGQSDVLGVGRDAFLDEVLVFEAAAVETFPGNNQRVILLGLFTGDQFLHHGEHFHNARQQGAPVHVIEAGRKLQCSGEILYHLDVSGVDELGQQFRVGEDEIAELVGLLFVEDVALDGADHGAEDFRSEDVGEGVRALLGEPEEQFAAGLMLADEAGERLPEQVKPVVLHEHGGAFAGQLGGRVVQNVDDGLMPERGGSLLEGLERATMLGGRHLVQQLAQLEVLVPDAVLGNLAFGGSQTDGGTQFVAQEDCLQGQCGLGALVAGDLRIQDGHGLGHGAGLVLQVFQAL